MITIDLNGNIEIPTDLLHIDNIEEIIREIRDLEEVCDFIIE